MFTVLGPLRVLRDGEPVSLGAKKQRTVLALLIARANRAVGLDDLIDEVWPDDPPESAVANVRTYAANLRREFAAAGEPDVHRPERRRLPAQRRPGHLRRAGVRRPAAAGRPTRGPAVTWPAAPGMLEEAGRLWRGSALGGDRGRCRGCVRTRRRSTRRTSPPIEELADVRVDLGAAAAALPALRELVTAHPLRERSQALLMRALHQQGDVAAALRVYTDARAALVEHLGVEPGPALRSAQREILAATTGTAASGGSCPRYAAGTGHACAAAR